MSLSQEERTQNIDWHRRDLPLVKADQNLRPIVLAKDNPFASHRVEAIPYRFGWGDWSENLTQLRSMGLRGSLIGDHGSGKTTLMLELKARLECDPILPIATHYCFVSRNVREHSAELEQLLQAAAAGLVLLVDGLERLSWRQRWRLLRHDPQQTRLILTAHRSLRWLGLPVWIHCRTDWKLMQTILEELIDAPDESMVQKTQGLFQQHRGNIREVLSSLYDQYAAGELGLK